MTVIPLTHVGESARAGTDQVRPLCPDCEKLVAWARRPILEEDDNIKFPFKPSHSALQSSALDCALCHFVLHKAFCGQVLHRGWDEETIVSYTVMAKPHGDLILGLTEIAWEETLPFPSPTISIPAWFYLANPDLVGSRAVWQPSLPTFDARFETVAEWISQCDRFHLECVSSPCALPRRLLDVSGFTKSATVRLLETSIMSADSIKYATLSHCWGPPSAGPPLRTTRANYSQHTEAIAVRDLTLNFHDAALVCEKLGLRYIWIDSLCIIQDDAADWEVEAARMADVYRGGYVNIAVNAASDAHGGIIRLTSLEAPETRLHAVHYAGSGSVVGGRTRETLIFQNNNGLKENRQRSVRNYPYLGRGWVFQELALSLRSVHFLRGQMFWQCRHCFTSEDGTMWEPSFGSLVEGVEVAGRARFETPAAAHGTWTWWMEAYSKRIFTFDSDAAPAMAGMIHDIVARTGWQPMLGLWRETLALDLHWERRRSSQHPRPSQARSSMFPSWTWLSVLPLGDGGGSLRGVRWIERCKISLRVEHWEEKWTGVPFTSCLESSKLVISAFVRDLSISVGPSTMDALISASHPDWEGSQCYCTLQNVDPGATRIDAKVVHLFQARLVSKTAVSFTDYFLIVASCPTRAGCYTRIGIGDVKRVVENGADQPEHYPVHFSPHDRQTIELA